MLDLHFTFPEFSLHLAPLNFYRVRFYITLSVGNYTLRLTLQLTVHQDLYFILDLMEACTGGGSEKREGTVGKGGRGNGWLSLMMGDGERGRSLRVEMYVEGR